MKKISMILVLSLLLGLLVAACAPAQPAANQAAPAAEGSAEKWNYEYISKVPPIMLRDPLMEMLGQTDEPIPFYYEEAAKMSGHSCMVVAAAWSMTRLALEALYPSGEVPVRGQIVIQSPGAEDEWNIGVFGEVMTFITGAAPKTGFSGSIFAKGNELTVRRNKLLYTEEPVGTPPPKMEWIFTRTDTGKSVAVSWNIALVQPPINEKVLTEPGGALAAGKATAEEAAKFKKDWNDAALFLLENAGKVDGLVTVKPVQ
ncbi:MAG: hypothetical protein B6D39_06860 [Anaerolineae bacterium UTCFX2]|jgi:hypothetical protein|nr:hypothetical protein [Anaerolineales bacterium]OQY91481.1 MAG: hypothetical protein B6D39_06860 [Anaerolineae bacterium UTCFX2]